jgi:hypothetical protein
MEGFMSSPIGQKQEITTSLMDAFYHTREAPPEFGFGTSVRPPLNDCEEAAPGPGAYTIKTTVLGDVPQSSIRSAPQFSLRSREKFGNPMLKAVDPTTMLEPGPGHYKARVVNPQEDCAPKFSFPKSSHPREKSKLAPGPGAYQLKPSVGRQVLSTKKSTEGTDFGRGDRPPLLQMSTADVGPGEYGCGIAACTKQVDSRKSTCSMPKFGTGTRNQAAIGARMANDDIPGPGNYMLPPALAGSGTAAYPFKSAPKPSMSGREKFGSPFGW